MKNFFPGFYRPTEDEFKIMWAEGLFVFDTNALLNLYSYPDSARNIFLSVLEKVRTRSWIPYQVALEFHRNRFNRIKQSNKPLVTLRDKIRAASVDIEAEVGKIEFEKRNTGVDNFAERLAAMRDAHSRLAEAIDKACAGLPEISLSDPIARQVSELFADRVGEPPADQASLDALVSDGNTRYERKVPPGFGDEKEKKDITYFDQELQYPAMYGDLILWRQLIAHIQQTGHQRIIFITGDVKEDWWLKVDNKLLGPHPDLVQELLKKTNAKSFWMYRADQFLKYAEDYLNFKEVTPETIAQVKLTTDHQNQQELIEKIQAEFPFRKKFLSFSVNDFPQEESPAQRVIFTARDYPTLYKDAFPSRFDDIEKSIKEWVAKQHEVCNFISRPYPDLTIQLSDESTWGYEIVAQSTLSRTPAKNAIKAGAAALKDGLVENFSVVVCLVGEAADRSDQRIQKYAEDIADLMFEYPISGAIIGSNELGRFSPLVRVLKPTV